MVFGRFRASALASGLATMLSLVMVLPGLAATTTATVTPASLAVNATSWYFYNDTAPEFATATPAPGKYEFVTGPGTPPAGVGSVRFQTIGAERWNMATSMFANTSLASLTALKFNTYQPSTGQGVICAAPGAECAVYLNFDVDFGPGVCPPVTCASTGGYQRRLVYVPAVNGTVATNTWQEWDALSASAQWTWSGYLGNGSKWPDGNTSQFRTWSAILTAFPNAHINEDLGSSQLLFRAGEPYPDGFIGFLDKVTIGVGSNTTVFDFEPYDVATDKDECKNGGWQNVRRADGSTFKNQGDCVSYTNNGK